VFKVDKHRIIAWFLLLLGWIEWMGYYFYILVNFHQVHDIEGVSSFFYLAYFLSPTIAYVWSLIVRKRPQFLNRIETIIIPIFLIVTIVCLFLFYCEFYKLIERFIHFPAQLDIPTLIIGLNGELTPNSYLLFRLCNAILFLGLMPWLLVFITRGTGVLQWEKELSLGGAFFFFYMFLRWGSLLGTPFRLMLMFLLCAMIWILPGTSSSPQLCDPPTFHHYPNIFLLIFGLVLSFLISAPGLSAQGFLFNSWIWGFGLVGTVVSLWLIYKKKLISRFLIGIIIFLCLWGLVILQILAQLIGELLAIHDILLAIGLLVSTFFSITTPAWNKFKINRERLEFFPHFVQWNCLGLIHIGFLLPMFAGTSDPITDIIVLSIIGGMGLLLGLKLLRKK
jgi:hypothetical protein